MSYNKTLFWGGGGDMNNENEIKDENEASYFYVQGVRQQRPKNDFRRVLRRARNRSPFLARHAIIQMLFQILMTRALIISQLFLL